MRLLHLSRRITLPPFLADVATLASGRFGATAIRFASVPIISRIFLPDAYGAIALYVSITTLLVTVGVFSLPQAIVLPEDDDEATRLAVLSVLGLCVVGSLTWLILLLAHILGLHAFQALGNWVWTVPLAVVLAGAVTISESWLVRLRRFRTSAMGSLTGAAALSSSRICMGLLAGSAVWPLAMSYYIGKLVNLWVYRKLHLRLVLAARTMARTKYIQTLREYIAFPLYNTPGALLSALNTQLPILALSYLFTSREVGQYAIVQALVVAMVAIVGDSLRKAFLYRVTRGEVSRSNIAANYLRTLIIAALVGLLPAIILFLFGEPLFLRFLGARWVEAGRYAAILAPWLYLQWLSMPAAALVVALRRQRFWSLLQLTVTISQCVGMAMGYVLSGSVYAVLTGFVLARSALLLFLVARMYLAAQSPDTAMAQ